MQVLLIFLFVCGALFAVAGHVMFLVAAFRASVPWGLAVLFLPLAPLVFLAMHWAEARKAFLVQIVGFLLVGAGFSFAATGGVRSVMEEMPLPIPEAVRERVGGALEGGGRETAGPSQPAAPRNYVGMTIRQVIRMRGAPKARLEADGQTVLLYPDLELTSRDGRTINHQDTPPAR